MRESLFVLRSNPRLATFPVVSAIVSLAVTVSFALPIFLTNRGTEFKQLEPLHYVILFAYYFSSYFVVTFFNAALISAAHMTMAGGNPTLGDGLSAAGKRIGPIAAWSLVSATVGTVLRTISENTGIVGQIIVSIFGAAWNIVTYFTVPMLVLEGVGPRDAIKGSFETIKRTWGETVIGNGGISLAMLLLALGPIPLFIGLCFTGSAWIIVPALVLIVLFWIGLAIVASALEGIYRTAVFTYARTGEIPAGFSAVYIQSAFAPKPENSISKLRKRF